MESIKIHRRVRLKEPIMLVAWPGMGNAAREAIDYLRRKMEAVPFAEINTSSFYTPEAVIIEKGLARLPQQTRNFFYFTRHPNLIIFESESQLRGKPALELMARILDLAQELKVQRIYTGAAFPSTMSYREPSQVFGVANKKPLRDFLAKFRVKMMEKGQISGLNGLLLGYAEERDIEAICLLATLPSYAINFPSPKASQAIVEVLEKILDIRIDMRELNLAVEEIGEKMALIEEKIKTLFPAMVKVPELVNLEKEKVPDYVMEKIGKLFREARVDRKKAYLLKEELDRWDLYKLYEDK
ncbi:PAC2 family protein, partial [candidate division NPL-UPA2 bacterium]|nr:PAC2 family protein [candidate division NPL-UPA2 bacterium]